jgi:hypothetical protein
VKQNTNHDLILNIDKIIKTQTEEFLNEINNQDCSSEEIFEAENSDVVKNEVYKIFSNLKKYVTKYCPNCLQKVYELEIECINESDLKPGTIFPYLFK